jgi:2-keto-4-pentenoate hydratase/2-oxohepta-3-ene-1,7-dioic acid hydratase in catechol pathway
MKLATLQTSSGPRVVSVHGDKYVDLRSGHEAVPATLKGLLSLEGWHAFAASTEKAAIAKGAFVTGDLLAPIGDPEKVVCIGLNYRDHAEESGQPIPGEPVCFNKFPTAVTGHGAPVPLPSVCTQIDYEAELVVVIGKTAKHVSEQDALKYVAGYMNGNDVSARDWQLNKPGKQWLMGKTPDGFAPTGPWLVTADEVADPGQLAISLTLNGQTMQNSSTKELIFNIPQLIAYLTQIVTLKPGDLIFTGTPPGVGMARKPPVFLKPGDTMSVTIAGLGTLTNPCTAG